MAAFMHDRLSSDFCAPNTTLLSLLRTWLEERKNGDLLLRLGTRGVIQTRRE